jgi:DNA-binding MarR family transcriptional regulator
MFDSMSVIMNHSVSAIIGRGLVSSFQLLQQSQPHSDIATIMDRFQEMQVFVRIAERHSFTQAADDLQMPRATVTNLMKRMEERLGARLLERTTRTVRLTPDGEEHYQRCVRLIADLEEAEGSF